MGTCCMLDNRGDWYQQFATVSPKKASLKIGTLNYGGILNNPFQFYIQEYAEELNDIKTIFLRLLPLYYPGFNSKTFEWKSAKLDKNFRKERYSPMFDPKVGIQNHSLLDKQGFQQKWQKVFNLQISKITSFKWTQQQKNDLKTYDTIMYNTLLSYCFDNDDIDKASKNDWHQYLIQTQPFFQLSFLDQEKKLDKLLSSFNRYDFDIFFFQQYSQKLLDHFASQSQRYYMATDAKKDTMILAKKSKFKQQNDIKKYLSGLDAVQMSNLDAAQRSSFMCLDNFVLICLHLSSKEAQFKPQIQKLIVGLKQLRTRHPDYQIIVGGDLNTFLDPSQLPGFFVEPKSQEQFTTLKKRTITQAQFKKADKSVKQSKDKLLTTFPIQAKIITIDGQIPNEDFFLPSARHPFDHFAILTG